jgi:hypothetical protein
MSELGCEWEGEIGASALPLDAAERERLRRDGEDYPCVKHVKVRKSD